MSEKSWQTVRLGDIAHVEHGWPFRSEEFVEFDDDLPIVVAIGNFDYAGGFRFHNSIIKAYRGEYPRKFELLPGDIMLVMTCQTAGGEILGVPARVPDDGRTYLHNQRIGKFIVDDPSKLDANFFYQWARSENFNRQLFLTATGTKILHTSPERILQTSMRLPPLCEQQAVADILGALDDKIAANERLYNLADQICAAEVRRASMTGVRRQLREVLKLHYGKALPATERTLGDVVVYGSGGITGTHFRPLVDRPGVIVGRKGTVGAVYWANGPHFPIDTTYYVEPCVAGTDEILYYLLRSASLAELNSDSAVPGLNRDEAYAYQVPFPRKETLDSLSRTLRGRFDWMKTIREEIKVLAATRDELLPLLMSGKVRVRDAEKVVEGVV